MAKVVPIFKSGDAKLTSNYRPLLLLISFRKIIEKAVYLQINNFLIFKGLLTECQYGFRSGLSTENAINDMLKKVYDDLDCREYASCVMIDLSKAFDTLNRSILLKKLDFYGIKGIPLKWFDYYLSILEKLVCIDGTNSISRFINIGVAQGSTFGPLLFVLYINDSLKCSNSFSFFLCADDTSALATDKNLNILILNDNHELEKVFDWFQVNQFSVNFSKCKYRMFRRRSQLSLDTPAVIMNSAEIE